MSATVHVVVHPVDTKTHPSVPPGWRWAVMVGEAEPDDLKACANAGWAPDARQAELAGDQAAATAVRVLHLLGVAARYGGVRRLDADPLPAGSDRINIA